MLRLATFSSLLMFCWLGVVAVSVAWGVQDDRVRFIADYKAALQALDHAERSISVDAVVTTEQGRPTDGKEATTIAQKSRSSVHHFEYRRQEDATRLRFYYDKPSFYDRVMVEQGRSGFVLRKNAPTSPYYIEARDLGPVFSRVIGKFRSEVVDAMTTLSHYRCLDLLAERGFKVTNLESIPSSTGGKFRVTFEFKPSPPLATQAAGNDATKKRPVKANVQQVSGSFVVNPALMYALEDYDIFVQHRPPIEASFHLIGHNEYASAGPQPILKAARSTNLLVDEGAKLNLLQVLNVEVSSWTYGVPVDSKFVLADYGLGLNGEPIQGWKVPLVVWGLVVAGILLALGAVLKRRVTTRMSG